MVPLVLLIKSYLILKYSSYETLNYLRHSVIFFNDISNNYGSTQKKVSPKMYFLRYLRFLLLTLLVYISVSLETK